MPIYHFDNSVSHEGVVLSTRERNYYDDSDFYAIVWTGKGVEEICYATTRCGGGGNAKADATPDVRAAYEAWQVELNAKYRAALAAEEAALPKVGRQVEVIRGRKHGGKSGRVFWRGANHYTNADRCGIETASGERFFVPGDYLQVQQEGGVEKS